MCFWCFWLHYLVFWLHYLLHLGIYIYYKQYCCPFWGGLFFWKVHFKILHIRRAYKKFCMISMQTLKWSVWNIYFLYQYPSNTPKCTTFDPYWMQNNLLFDITFCIHNNLTMIKILSAIYPSLAVLFLSIPLYWHH